MAYLFLSLILFCPEVEAKGSPLPLYNGGEWYDTDGQRINCHGGNIIKTDSLYYWYGEHRPGFDTNYQKGVTCYSSPDLVNWKNEGIVLPVVDDTTSVMQKGCTIERPKVVYCPKTGKYMLWFHHELKGRGYEAAHVGVAESESPTGPFQFLYSQRVNAGKYPLNFDKKFKGHNWYAANGEWWTPEWRKAVKEGMFTERDRKVGQMSRDMTIFVDDDGRAYHIYSSEENATLQIAELTKDYTYHTGKYVRIFPAGLNEAPVVFKKDGKYWMICSGCTGWAPNEARMFSADDIMGEWTEYPTPFVGEGSDTTFGSQGAFPLMVDGKVYFFADEWRPGCLADSRYKCFPIEFGQDGRPVIRNVRITPAFMGKASSVPVSYVDTSMEHAEKFVLRVDGQPIYMTNVQLRLDKLRGYEGWNDRALEKVVHQAAADGFNTVSIPLFWREVEPRKDVFDWTVLDQYLDWCLKYDLKMELLWFSFSSGGRIQWLTRNKNVAKTNWTLRVPDYVCDTHGNSEFTIRRTEDPWTLDWNDTRLRERDRYVLSKVMDHVAAWDSKHGNPHTVIGVQLGNEALGHEHDVSAETIVDYTSFLGSAVKESDYPVWTRMNCVSWMTRDRLKANESKRLNGGTNIDFVGIDIYGTDAEKVFGDMDGQLPHMGKNYTMIMEIDAKDPRTPFYQMTAIAGNKAFDYYNYAVVDGNSLYEDGGNMTLKERPQIVYVRQRNKLINDANALIATKAHGRSLYVYNRQGRDSVVEETGLDGITYTSASPYSQAMAIRYSPKEIILQSAGVGLFRLPDNMSVRKVSKGHFDKSGIWVSENSADGKGNVIKADEASTLKILLY